MGKIEITDFFSMSEDHPLYTPIRNKLIIAGKTPDKDSNFDKKTLEYRSLANEEFLQALKKKGYDVLVIHKNISDEEAYLYGYIAYQIEEGRAGIFRRIVHEEVEGNSDLTRKLIKGTLDHLRKKGAERVTFDRDSEELISFLKTKENELGILVSLKTKSLVFLPL
jgi:hypothetical protein